MTSFPAPHRNLSRLSQIATALSLTIVMITSLAWASVADAPLADLTIVESASAQNVDWMSAESAYTLDIGMTVLVPSFVPAPFGGEASISASGGYYSLYWMISGGSPTFLQITGTAGAQLPAGSPYDLNVQLFINSSVQGNDAIHDVTPIYDSVWWISGGVLYNVQSQNMTGSDSLSLANSLFALDPPAAPEPEVPVEPPVNAPDQPPVDEAGPIDETAPTDQAAPIDESQDSQEISDPEGSTSQDQPDSNGDPSGTSSDPATGTDSEPADSAGGDSSETPAPSGDGSGGNTPTGPQSDGTGGAVPPVYGGDGTGGGTDVVLPALISPPVP